MSDTAGKPKNPDVISSFIQKVSASETKAGDAESEVEKLILPASLRINEAPLILGADFAKNRGSFGSGAEDSSTDIGNILGGSTGEADAYDADADETAEENSIGADTPDDAALEDEDTSAPDAPDDWEDHVEDGLEIFVTSDPQPGVTETGFPDSSKNSQTGNNDIQSADAAADDRYRATDDAPEYLGMGPDDFLDEDALRDMVSEIVREELQGDLGEKITRNVRKLVRREIHRALVSNELS